MARSNEPSPGFVEAKCRHRTRCSLRYMAAMAPLIRRRSDFEFIIRTGALSKSAAAFSKLWRVPYDCPTKTACRKPGALLRADPFRCRSPECETKALFSKTLDDWRETKHPSLCGCADWLRSSHSQQFFPFRFGLRPRTERLSLSNYSQLCSGEIPRSQARTITKTALICALPRQDPSITWSTSTITSAGLWNSLVLKPNFVERK